MTPGVKEVTSGYAGGEEIAPTYRQVKSQSTHHRETIKIDYDPQVLSYQGLLQVFLSHIDPLDDQGQFGDMGYSYTTAIYYQDEEEKAIAADLLAELADQLGETPKVSLEPMKRFWTAEEEHLHYYLNHPEEWAEEMRASGRGAIHKMSLAPEPFAAIAQGRKRVEMRLNDPKRRGIQVGDQILFVRTDGEAALAVSVTDIRAFADFAALYAAFDPLDLGYRQGEKADPKDMEAYYTPQEIATYGVVALTIRKIDRFE